MLCIHAAQGVEQRLTTKAIVVETGDFFLPCVRLCEECAAKWRLLQDEHEKETFLGTLVPVCAKCLSDAIK